MKLGDEINGSNIQEQDAENVKEKPFSRSLDTVKKSTSDIYKKLETSEHAVLKLGMTVASPGVSIANYLFSATEPYVDDLANKLDSSFGPTVQKIQESPGKLAGGLKEKSEEIGKSLDYNQDGIVTCMDIANTSVAGGKKVVDGIVCSLQNRYDALLLAGQENLDYYLPDYDGESDTEDAPKKEAGSTEARDDEWMSDGDVDAGGAEVEPGMQRSLKGLSSTATKRVKDRMNAGIGEIRKFSSGRLKEIVHVDLIEYAEKVIDTSKGVVSYVEERSECFQVEANNYFGDLMPKINSAIEAASETTAKLQSTLKETIDPRREQLSIKLQQAIQSASHTMSPVRNAVTPYVGNVSEKVNSLGGGLYSLLDTVPVNEIPKDVWLVLAGTVGIRERDPRFNEVVDQIRDVFLAVADLQKLKSSAQNEMEKSKKDEMEVEGKDVSRKQEDGNEGGDVLKEGDDGEEGDDEGDDDIPPLDAEEDVSVPNGGVQEKDDLP